MRTRLLLSLAVVAAASGTARAQFYGVAAAGQEEGPGVQVSDGTVLHPGLALEGGYDSNVFYENAQANPVAAPLLRALAHFDWSTLPPQRLTNADGSESPQDVEFRMRGYLDFRHYFESNTTLSNNYLGAGLSPHVTFNPQGSWSLKLYDDYVRTSDPSNQQTTLGYVQDYNNAGLNFHARPGGGALDLGAGVVGNVDVFEASQFRFANHYGGTGDVFAQWSFLPQTALRVDGSWGLVSFMNVTALTPANSIPLKAWATLVGRITATITGNVYAGYGNSFSASGPSYNMAIGGARFDWAFAPQGKVGIHYDHTFDSSFLANYYQDDRFGLSFQELLGGRFVIQLTGDAYLRTYQGIPAGYAWTGPRNDVIVEAHANLDYQIGQWLFTGLEYDLLDDSTTFQTQGFPVAFVKNVIMAKLDASF